MSGGGFGGEIRTAEPDDHDAILEVVRRAFTKGAARGDDEVRIVNDTWRLGAVTSGLELVAVMDDVVVGHVLGAYGRLNGAAVVGIAPLAVAPAHQGAGVGSALMRDVIGRAERAGEPALVLLGNPEYYARFGFEPSGPLGMTYAPVGPDSPHFQVRRLAAFDSRREELQGEFRYCWELDG